MSEQKYYNKKEEKNYNIYLYLCFFLKINRNLIFKYMKFESENVWCEIWNSENLKFIFFMGKFYQKL